jgi:hypothetical protein
MEEGELRGFFGVKMWRGGARFYSIEMANWRLPPIRLDAKD